MIALDRSWATEAPFPSRVGRISSPTAPSPAALATTQAPATVRHPLCPSTRPDAEGAVIFAVLNADTSGVARDESSDGRCSGSANSAIDGNYAMATLAGHTGTSGNAEVGADDGYGTKANFVVQGVPRVGYLQRAARPSRALLALASPATPAEVFRFGGRCAEGGCRHFEGARCALAAQLVQRLPAVADQPPPCAVRSACRWFQEQGPALCRRCAQVVQPAFAPRDFSS